MSDDPPRFKSPRVTINRVYTRRGDAGTTSLVGGQKVDKDDLRIEAYGTVDELNAWIGSAAVECASLKLDELTRILRRVQHELFNLGSLLATLPEDLRPQQARPEARDVTRLEADIDRFNADLPILRSFVLPGSGRADAVLHLARVTCRRAERRCVALARQASVDSAAVTYLNRLSDALFVWGRWVTGRAYGEEVLWSPNVE